MNSRILKIFCSVMIMTFLFIISFSLTNAENPNDFSKRVAIVIDDFGNNMAGTKEMLDLEIPLTVAVMPFLTTSIIDANTAHEKGHDVIVHMPMEAKNANKDWLGPGAITTDLSDEEMKRRVHAAIDAVPHAIGMNNHMGSKATADERVMRKILEVCRERGLIYIDSKTNYYSVVRDLAEEIGVPYAENHIFLDDVTSINHISHQCQLIMSQLTERHPECIAIGHVGRAGKSTAAVLQNKAADMQKEVEFVGVSELVPDYQLSQ
ncbi:divergent polysaccharide deacetylase family protein [Alteribacillus sp. YIM 98480]|uniref:divergent polysaccharide deacetylase family protein n=1 Tax=Alteribacillus sp. YIM 98480 TaxID=2606599 RepID=UPI00131D6D54|nr:divergent polysaccharide deacetylase family protein [Alteribacillus sp. YIM 98480]